MQHFIPKMSLIREFSGWNFWIIWWHNYGKITDCYIHYVTPLCNDLINFKNRFLHVFLTADELHFGARGMMDNLGQGGRQLICKRFMTKSANTTTKGSAKFIKYRFKIISNMTSEVTRRSPKLLNDVDRIIYKFRVQVHFSTAWQRLQKLRNFNFKNLYGVINNQHSFRIPIVNILQYKRLDSVFCSLGEFLSKWMSGAAKSACHHKSRFGTPFFISSKRTESTRRALIVLSTLNPSESRLSSALIDENRVWNLMQSKTRLQNQKNREWSGLRSHQWTSFKSVWLKSVFIEQ